MSGSGARPESRIGATEAYLNRNTFVAFALAVGLSGAAGFFSACALGAAEKPAGFEQDSRELTLTEEMARRDLAAAVGALRRIAGEATAKNFEADKARREREFEAALKPLQDDSVLLLLQAHLLSLTRVADEAGDAAEQQLQQAIYDRLKVPAAEVAKRKETTGLGHGSLILGYLTAKVARMPAEEVFAEKKNKSWAELLRAHNLSASEIFAAVQNP